MPNLHNGAIILWIQYQYRYISLKEVAGILDKLPCFQWKHDTATYTETHKGIIKSLIRLYNSAKILLEDSLRMYNLLINGT